MDGEEKQDSLELALVEWTVWNIFGLKNMIIQELKMEFQFVATDTLKEN